MFHVPAHDPLHAAHGQLETQLPCRGMPKAAPHTCRERSLRARLRALMSDLIIRWIGGQENTAV